MQVPSSLVFAEMHAKIQGKASEKKYKELQNFIRVPKKKKSWYFCFFFSKKSFHEGFSKSRFSKVHSLYNIILSEFSKSTHFRLFFFLLTCKMNGNECKMNGEGWKWPDFEGCRTRWGSLKPRSAEPGHEILFTQGKF